MNRKHKTLVAGQMRTRKNGHGETKNGFVHVVSPATASEVRRVLGIRNSQIKNVLRAFETAGVKA